jgi:mono/diheme cytochrome c family protein
MVNFNRPVWSLLGWACVAGGTFGAGVVYGQYAANTYVTIPHYGAGAGPQTGEPPPAEPQPEWAKRVEQKVDKLLKLLEELDDKTPDKAAPVAAGNALQSAAETCARCHAADNFKAKGDGFQLFNDKGEFRELSDRDVRKIVKELEGRTMPPPKSGNNLREDEYSALIGAFKPTTNGRKQ